MKMKIALVLGALALSGCSSLQMSDNTTIQESKGTDTVPTWYLEPSIDSEIKIYSVGTGVSDDLQFSLDKAMHEAKLILGDKIGATASADYKRYISDNAKGSLSETVQETQKVSKSGFKDIDVSMYTVTKKSVLKEGSMYRTYVMLELKVDDKPQPNSFDAEDKAKSQAAMDSL